MIQRNLNLLRGSGDNDLPPIKFDTIIFALNSMMVRQLGNILYLSVDGGVSYTKSINVSVVGEIRNIHVFSNETTSICGHKKAYYTEDWITLTEATVKGIDGLTFVPVWDNDNFTSLNGTENQTVDGVESLMWGNYNNYENTNPATNTAQVFVWFTKDKGKTINCIFKFWESTAMKAGVPTVMTARHMHNVQQNPVDKSFWIQTGDEPRTRDSQWIRATYDNTLNVWNFVQIGVGDAFKTTYLKFVGDYIYYAYDSTGSGLRRVKTIEASDVSKHEIVYNAGNDLLGFSMGERGDIVLITTKFFGNISGKLVYYSPDLINWHIIEGAMPDGYTDDSIYGRIFQPNANGKVLSAIQVNYSQQWRLFNFKPSIFLDEVIKRAGFPDAFKPL